MVIKVYGSPSHIGDPYIQSYGWDTLFVAPTGSPRCFSLRSPSSVHHWIVKLLNQQLNSFKSRMCTIYTKSCGCHCCYDPHLQ